MATRLAVDPSLRSASTARIKVLADSPRLLTDQPTLWAQSLSKTSRSDTSRCCVSNQSSWDVGRTFAVILGRVCGSVLRQWSVVREGEIPTVADHHMIEEGDAEELARLGDPSREGPVFGAR